MTIHVVEFAAKPDPAVQRDHTELVSRLHELITQVEAGEVDAVALVSVNSSSPGDLTMFVSTVEGSKCRTNDVLASMVHLQNWYVNRSRY